MRVLIAGSRGQLGRDLLRVFSREGEAVGMHRPELDIVNRSSVERAVRQTSPEIVINAAAYTNVEGAEDHEAEAFAINEGGAKTVALAARAAGLPILHISTDFVYDGRKTTPYEPTDPPNPLSVYGRSKLAGDVAVRESNPRHFILRTAWFT